MDQFEQIKTMLTSFYSPRQETTRTACCNYLASRVNLECESFKCIKSRTEERIHQPNQPSLCGSPSTTFTCMPLSYQQQQPQQRAASGREYILTILETEMPASQAIQPAQQSQVVPRGQQQPRGPQTSYLVVDEQQPSTSRQLNFTISLTKAFNLPSVASVTGESAHNISGLSSIQPQCSKSLLSNQPSSP